MIDCQITKLHIKLFNEYLCDKNDCKLLFEDSQICTNVLYYLNRQKRGNVDKTIYIVICFTYNEICRRQDIDISFTFMSALLYSP